MADPRFHIHAGTRTLEEVARAGGAEILRGDPAFSLTDVAPLDQAGPGEIASPRGGATATPCGRRGRGR